jgi:hypothetical protein
VVGGISPAECDLTVFEGDQTAIGYGYAMGVSAKIAEHVFRSAKWALAVDDPIVAKQLPDPGRERLGMRQKAQLPMETELTFAIGAFEPGHELPAKNRAENLHRQEECISRFDPAAAVGG